MHLPPPRVPQHGLEAAKRWQERATVLRLQLKDDEPTEEYDKHVQARAKAKSYKEFEALPVPPERKPKHKQMKAKIDGEGTIIFVRKSDLMVTFHNVRPVKNDHQTHAYPTNKTDIPIYPVAMYSATFTEDASGVFMPMEVGSVLRICFDMQTKHSRNPYMVRIYAGMVNVISGKMDFEKGNTREQDYIVVPEQTHIDGFAVTNNHARQFLAPREGPGFSFDWPYQQGRNGEPVFSSLRFEITPFEFENKDDYFIRANGWLDRKMMLPIMKGAQLQIPARIQHYFGIDASLVKWEHRGRKFADG
jgi:hypothetical protein